MPRMVARDYQYGNRETHPTFSRHVLRSRQLRCKRIQFARNELWIKKLKPTGPGIDIYDISRTEKKLEFLSNPGAYSRQTGADVSDDNASARRPVGRSRVTFCKSCAEIPSLISKQWETKQVRLELPKIANLKSSCRFCGFLLEVYNRIYRPFHGLDQSSSANDEISPVLVIVVSEFPWHEIAAIRADLKDSFDPYQYALLQFLKSPREEICEPFICVSLEKAGGQDPVTKNSPETPFANPKRRGKAQSANATLDFDQIRSWIALCNKEHGRLCQKSGNLKRGLLDINLINVHTREIVRDTEKAEYAALSYVWGSTGKQQSKVTFDDPKGSVLGILPANLPKTIEDAITFSKKIGLDFLWIDHYCLDESDPVKFQEQIGDMDLVYECACITIVAVWGSSMDVGLPGISTKLFCADQPCIKTKHGTFSATFVDSMWTRQGKRPWDLRGWTFQEGILSSRSIFFDRSHTYMRCRQELFFDILEVDTERVGRLRTDQSNQYFWENGYAINLEEEEWDFGTYDALVANYSGRTLGRQSDVLDACRGALNHITRNTGIGFSWGLPLIDFHKSLLWKAYNGNCVTRRNDFPSWSWVGWIGRTEYSYWLDSFDDYKHQAKIEAFGILAASNHLTLDPRNLPREDAYIHTKSISESTGAQVLKISSYLAIFQGKIVRRQGNARGRHTQGKRSQLPEYAVGDEWTLVNAVGDTLSNPVGDSPYFEECDYFFQIAPQLSEDLKQRGSKLRLLFIRHWPRIKDPYPSHQWISDTVSALVISPVDGRRDTRIACVHLKLEDWKSASPRPGVVELI